MNRYVVLNEVLLGSISLKKAQELLCLSYIKVIRIKKRFILERVKGLKRRLINRPPNLKLTSEFKEEIFNLRRTL